MGPQVHRPPSEDRQKLGVLRIGKGDSQICLFLGEGRILGLITHYWQKQGYRCPGEGCKDCARQEDRIWKGYVPVLHWRKTEKFWLPAILEISESLELDLRGVYSRGQVWEFRRAMPEGGKKPPITGRWNSQWQQPLACPAFDVLPGVRWLYHDDAIELNTPSPLPERVLVDPIHMAAPGESAKNAPPTPEEKAKFRKTLNGLLGRNGGAAFGALPGGDVP